MVLPQRATAEAGFRLVPPVLSTAAASYQQARETEKEQLALMARHDLLGEWTEEITSTVLTARGHIRDAAAARGAFRRQIREFVTVMRGANEPLSTVLRHTRSMMALLENTGAIAADGGWLEAEVLEWVIEDFENL